MFLCNRQKISGDEISLRIYYYEQKMFDALTPPKEQELRTKSEIINPDKLSEPFGAFFIIEAKDRDEAIRITALHPGAHVGEYLGGGIEVHPIEMFDQD